MIKGLFSGLIAILDVAPARVLASLGMGFISYAAITTVVTTFVGTVDSHYSTLGGASLQLASLAGFPTGLGMVVGAIIARLSLNALPSLGKIT